MKYFLLLKSTCAGDISSCCKDYGLATYLHIVKEVLNLIHFIVPIILLIMVTVDLAKMVINPDDPQKKKSKSLYNKILAAVLIFFIPNTVNVVFSFVPDNISDLSGCWKSADQIFNKMKNTKQHSSEVDQYDRPTRQSSSSTTNTTTTITGSSEEEDSSSSSSSSSKGSEIAEYAKKFVGNKYEYASDWSGEEPYTPTDCSGFTQGVYKHFGVSLNRTAAAQYTQGTIVTSIAEAQPGDLLFYADKNNGHVSHVSMYIGNNQVVHASSTKTGVIISDVGYRQHFAIKRMI